MDLYKNLNLHKVEHKEGIKVNIKDDQTTSNGRRPQNIKSRISQQPLIGFSSNFKLKLRGPNQNQKCLKQRRPPMEDNLQWSDLPQNLNLSSGDQTKMING